MVFRYLLKNANIMDNYILEFRKIVKDFRSCFKSHVEAIMYLYERNYDRIDLMILDSAIKNLPIEKIPNTLLLLKEDFSNRIENMTYLLADYVLEVNKNKLGII